MQVQLYRIPKAKRSLRISFFTQYAFACRQCTRDQKAATMGDECVHHHKEKEEQKARLENAARREARKLAKPREVIDATNYYEQNMRAALEDENSRDAEPGDGS